MHAVSQVRNLRERLEEEHQALLQREQDKAALEARIMRLTRVILHSTRIPRPCPGSGARYRHLLLSQAQVGSLTMLVSDRRCCSHAVHKDSINNIRVGTWDNQHEGCISPPLCAS